MKVTVDPQNPPRKEELNTEQLRKKLAAQLLAIGDQEFQDWLLEIGLNQVGQLWPSGKFHLSGTSGQYVLTDLHPEPRKS